MTNPIARADRATRLLADEIIVEAREHMRESLTRAMWRRHELTDVDQQKLDAYVRHYADFFGWFERVLADGKIADADLQNKSRARQLIERVKSI